MARVQVSSLATGSPFV